jgi:hypothetical protein
MVLSARRFPPLGPPEGMLLTMPHSETTMSEKPHGEKSDGDKALTQYEAEGRAVRANMEKLRALRLAKEAAEAAAAPPARAKTRKVAAKPAKKEAPAKLSDWLANQQKGGFRT